MRDNEALIKKAQNGDEMALSDLVERNMGLVKKLAVRFVDRGADYEDLVQIGCIGMIKAIRSFDFSYECVFSTYAVPLIIGEIRRFLRDDGIIKISRQTKRQGVEILRAKEKFISENNREPRVSELAQITGVSCEEAVYCLEAVNPVHSLSEQAGEEDGELGDFISDKQNEMENITDRIALKEAIRQLPDIQQKIILLRYYKDMSQQQTGKILGLSQVKVSREEKKILSLLREAL